MNELHSAIATVRKMRWQVRLDAYRHWIIQHPVTTAWLSLMAAITIQALLVAATEMAEFTPHIEAYRFDFFP